MHSPFGHGATFTLRLPTKKIRRRCYSGSN